eukprot:504929-Amphidinium_carterae.1
MPNMPMLLMMMYLMNTISCGIGCCCSELGAFSSFQQHNTNPHTHAHTHTQRASQGNGDKTLY